MDLPFGYDVLMPDEWHPHDIQHQLIKAGIKYPIKYHLGRNCYMPAFGDLSMRYMIQETGGNALSGEDRSKICLVITHPVHGFNYEKAMFGYPMRDGRFIEGFFPETFYTQARSAQKNAIDELVALTDQKYEVLGAKLNPLSSGLANIVLYVRFKQACPFEKQFYSNRIRFVPSPLIAEFEEPAKCFKVMIEFLNTDDGVFKESYDFVQNISTNVLGCRLRHVKHVKAKNELHVLSQIEDDSVLHKVEDKYKKIEQMLKAAFNRSYIFKGVRFEIVTMI